MSMKRLVLAAIGAFTLCAGLPVMAAEGEGGEDVLPQVTEDQVVWDGGLLDIPVDFGSYSPEDLRIAITVSGEESDLSYSSSYAEFSETNENVVSFSPVTEFYSCDDEQLFTKAGTYTAKLEFRDSDNEPIATDEFQVVINEDSEMWHMEYEEYSFDGTEDIVLHFTNGTNNYRIKEITSYVVFVSMLSDNGEFTEGYEADMEAGTITFDKEAIKNAIIETAGGSKDNIPGMGSYGVAINVYALTEDGETVRFNRISEPGSDTGATTSSLWLDITDLDFGSETEDSQEPAGSEPTTEFVGVNISGAQISEEDGNVISSSALAYIQNNYPDQLEVLGNDYQVEARMVIEEMDKTDIPEEVQEALVALIENGQIGQYYDISIQADVLKDGEIVEGLEDIYIAEMTDEITISINIPDSVLSDGRTYTMLRYHDGQAASLTTSVSDGNVIFSSSDFSTYALAYDETESENGTNSSEEKSTTDSTQNDSVTSPQTGDEMNLTVMVFLLFSCLAAGAAAFRVRKLNK